MDKYKSLATRQATISRDTVCNFYADTLYRLARYGGLGLSTDHKAYYDSAQRILGDVGLHKLTARLAIIARDVFTLAARDNRTLLDMIFTFESIQCAISGPWRDDEAVGSKDPAVHFSYAAQQTVTINRDELMSKYQTVFDQDMGHFVELYTDASLRLNAFGVDFGSRTANSLDWEVHYRWAENTEPTILGQETARRIRLLFDTLS